MIQIDVCADRNGSGEQLPAGKTFAVDCPSVFDADEKSAAGGLASLIHHVHFRRP
jgi:hypothetical protein